ncbi:hypothetical protein ABAC460_07690 [Asticcacaulis sp. AC460]|uniref:beta strand repeat-containing protein n=1 Tax=Asticcacaulis sp. AC460 TaxID=1282360 RepID=UPI0003C3D1C4|nr:calcium-binding protein [Asticcacaulis sp. AC460]ESQ90951.1 hypothetical protein ABAC460_07690 [Asticcacaulis sp. AC460]
MKHALFDADAPQAWTGTVENDSFTASGDTAWTLDGLAGNDVLTGSAQDDTITGGLGNDTLFGGAGYDTFIVAAGVTSYDAYDGGDGIDTILANADNQVIGITTLAGIEGIYSLGWTGTTIGGTAAAESWDFSNVMLFGITAINAGDGNDSVKGANDDDRYDGGGGNDTITGGTGADTIRGGTGEDDLSGDHGDDRFEYTGTNSGADSLTGGDGYDIALALAANTTIDIKALNGVEEISGAGFANITVVASAGDELLDFSIVSLVDIQSIRGGSGNDTIVGSAAADVLLGEAGNDSLSGGNGDDAFRYGDSVAGGGDSIDGGAGNDIVIATANKAILTLDRVTGVETISSGDFSGVSILGGDNAGLMDLSAVTLMGITTIDGGGGNDTIYGNSEANTVSGGAGEDVLYGGGGNDRYIVDSVADIVSESASGTGDDGGWDTVYASVSWSLSGYVENLTLTGTANIDGTGTDIYNFIVGNDGDNRLDGKGGADILAGGLGNDTYVLDNTDDHLSESAGEGIDLVEAGISYSLATLSWYELENLTLTGTDNLNGGGNGLNNVITGNTGNNSLSGGAGNDTLKGGAGDDTYIIDGGDTLVENAAEGTDQVEADFGYTLGDYLENLVLTGSAAIHGTGNGLDNRLTGNSGINALTGSWGNDTYVVQTTGDTVTEFSGQGTDLVESSVTFTLGNHVENLILTGSAAINATGNSLNNRLTGNSGVNTLTGGLGNDTYIVQTVGDNVVEANGEGTDLIESSVSYNLTGRYVETLTLTGSDNINATGNGVANALNGNVGDNLLDGGAGIDTMKGGLGNDTYVVSIASDQVLEYAGEGTDLVQSACSLTLGANLENLTLTGANAVNATGNSLNNVLTGNSATNNLSGGAGDDTYIVGAGDIVVESTGNGTDTVQSDITWSLAANVENLVLTGANAVNGTGNTLNNSLTGNSAANILSGGLGDDTYVVGLSDIVTEAASEGTDAVESSLTWTLEANVENLVLTGTAAIDGSGNEMDNRLTGNIAANTLSGGLGNDTYVAQAGDTFIELSGEGTDQVEADFSYSLGANIENLTLSGTAAINATGNGLDNRLTGNSASNTLTGGLGNDTYVVQNTGDNVVEANGQGTDLIESSVTYNLTGRYVETLTLTGTDAINATGNGQANTLNGNAGDNVLDGGAGIDTMSGGAGNDTFIVNIVSDQAYENADEGTDLVLSTCNFTLGANIENLTLTGTSAANATGNSLNNVLTGNSAANSLAGGAGDDTYIIGAGDTVVESAAAGTDTVQSGLTWTLGANIEILVLTGANAIDGTGNSLNNRLIGNSAANTLSGGLGDDTYVVGLSDTVVENASEGIDTVESDITWVLGDHVEHLTLTGTAAIDGTGNGLDNRLTGNSASNVLTGGLGNDTYVVQAGDTVIELTGEGTDQVETDITYTLGSEVENLTLTGSAAINGNGNGLNNILTGNSGVNVLTGGLGNDSYYIQNATDNVVEAGGEGTDVIISTVSYSLNGRFAETLTLTGSANLTATGNSVANTLNGNDGDNTINGKGGADLLSGGLGADIFLFETGCGKDTITDFSAAQNDSININAYTAGVSNSGLVAQNGANVVITLATGHTITVNNAVTADVLAHIVW